MTDKVIGVRKLEAHCLAFYSDLAANSVEGKILYFRGAGDDIRITSRMFHELREYCYHVNQGGKFDSGALASLLDEVEKNHRR